MIGRPNEAAPEGAPRRRSPRPRRALSITLLALGSLAAFAVTAQAAQSTITAVAGNGTEGYIGDLGPAPSAELARPDGVAPLPRGGFLIADTDNNVIRKVSASGRISTVAGTGTGGYMGDHGPATSAELDQPNGVAPLTGGGFLIADTVNSVIRKVSASGRISTVAGTGVANFGGDNGPAVSAELFFPQGVAPLLQFLITLFIRASLEAGGA